jgi:HSP20 family protein
MVWSQDPRLLSTFPWRGWADPFGELNRIQSEMARLLGPARRALLEREFPPVRVATNDDGALLQALVPGVAPEKIEVTVHGDTLSLKGEREAPAPAEGATWHRNERRTGRFARTVTLPFEVDPERVEARFENGVLEVRLPRVASQRPRKIEIATS